MDNPNISDVTLIPEAIADTNAANDTINTLTPEVMLAQMTWAKDDAGELVCPGLSEECPGVEEDQGKGIAPLLCTQDHSCMRCSARNRIPRRYDVLEHVLEALFKVPKLQNYEWSAMWADMWMKSGDCRNIAIVALYAALVAKGQVE